MLSKEDLIIKRENLTRQMLQIQGAINFITQEILRMEREELSEKNEKEKLE